MIINMNGAKAPETPSPVLQEKTVTPQTLPTVIGADEGYAGLSQVTVNPDTNLKAENIRSGKTIFGVDGTFVGEETYNGDIFPFLINSTPYLYSFYYFSRPIVISKTTAVFSDDVGSLPKDQIGRVTYNPCYLFRKDTTLWGIGSCAYGAYNYSYNYPTTLPKADPTTINITENVLRGVTTCKVRYCCFPLVDKTSVDVGSYGYFDLSYSISDKSHIFYFDDVCSVTGTKMTITTPELPEVTVYHSTPSLGKPSSTYYVYWAMAIIALEGIA